MNSPNRIVIAAKGTKKPVKKGLTVRIVGAEGDLPLAVIVRAPEEKAQVRLVLHPRRGEGVGLVTDDKGARVWTAEGTDSPVAGWKLTLAPKAVTAQIEEMTAEASAGRARGVTHGKWSGEAKRQGEGLVITLVRTMGSSEVRLVSLAYGWDATANGNNVGTHPMLTQAVSAALQALVLTPQKKTCAPPAPRRGKAVEAPPAPPVLNTPTPKAARAPRSAEKKAAKAPKASKDKEPAQAPTSDAPPAPKRAPAKPAEMRELGRALARQKAETIDEVKAALRAQDSPRFHDMITADHEVAKAWGKHRLTMTRGETVPYAWVIDELDRLKSLGAVPFDAGTLSAAWRAVQEAMLRGTPVTFGMLARASVTVALDAADYQIPNWPIEANAAKARLPTISEQEVEHKTLSQADVGARVGLKLIEGRRWPWVPRGIGSPTGELDKEILRADVAQLGGVTLDALWRYSNAATRRAAALMQLPHTAKPFAFPTSYGLGLMVPRKVLERLGLDDVLPLVAGGASTDGHLRRRLLAQETVTPLDLTERHRSVAIAALRRMGFSEDDAERQSGSLIPLSHAGLSQVYERYRLKVVRGRVVALEPTPTDAIVPDIAAVRANVAKDKALAERAARGPITTGDAPQDRWTATEDQLAAVIPWDVYQRAHQHTSHDPEGRATREQRAFVALVKARRDAVKKLVEQAPQLDAEARRVFDRYVDGLTRAKTRQLQGNANVVSVLVAGPDGMRGVSQRRRAQWAKRDDDDMQALKRVEDAFTSSLNGLMRQAAPKSAAAARAAEERAEEQSAWVEQTIELPGGVTVEYAVADERLRIRLPGRPDPELAARLKRSGWLWSPRNTAWQRKLTSNARLSAAQILEVPLPPLDGRAAQPAAPRPVTTPPTTRGEPAPEWLAPLGRLPEGVSFNDIKGAPRPLVDAAGRRYTQRHMIVLTAIDGSGPVIPSNDPRTLRPMAPSRYPPEFQARTLANIAEVSKIQAMRRDLEPWRLLAEHGDATMGAPVCWEAPDGALLVLAGNGRTLALFGAADRLTQYQRELYTTHIGIWPLVRQGAASQVTAPAGYTWMLVRLIQTDDRRPLSQAEAAAFAAASQASTSAGESPLGAAVSFARGLGLDSATALAQLGPLRWRDRIGPDNIPDFVRANAAWVETLLSRMDAAKRQRTRSDPGLLAQAVAAVMTARLPRPVLAEGFTSEGEERALIGALPLLLTMDAAIKAGQIDRRWALLDEVDAARRFALRVKGKSDEAAVTAVERGAQQEQIDGVRTLWDDLTPLGVCLGLLFKRASKARDPAIPVVEVLSRFMDTAEADVPGQSSMFASVAADPATTLAALLRVRLPAQTRA